MTNQQQIDANRRNAKKSTGPRTAGGRRRSRMNALKHGMAAEDVVIPGQEDPAELRASHLSYIADWEPVGTTEEKLVWEMTIADWRLRRARMIEARLVEFASAECKNDHRRRMELDAMVARVHAETHPDSQPNELNDAEGDANDAEPESDGLDDAGPDQLAELLFVTDRGLHRIGQLLRYESAAERSFYRAFHTLERLQAKRMGKEVSLPQVMHVHAHA